MSILLFSRFAKELFFWLPFLVSIERGVGIADLKVSCVFNIFWVHRSTWKTPSLLGIICSPTFHHHTAALVPWPAFLFSMAVLQLQDTRAAQKVPTKKPQGPYHKMLQRSCSLFRAGQLLPAHRPCGKHSGRAADSRSARSQPERTKCERVITYSWLESKIACYN